MSTGVDIEVQTVDAVPLAPPYKISRRAGHTDALVAVTLRATTDIYYALRVSRGSRRAPAPLIRRGLVCGVDRCGPGRRALVTNGDVQATEDVTVEELGETVDGPYTFNVHYLTNEGWG